MGFEGSRGHVRPDTDPKSVRNGLNALATAGRGRLRPVVQFNEPLSASLRDALAETLRDFPDVELYVYGAGSDAQLGELSPFHGVRHLNLNLRGAKSYDSLAAFTNMSSLVLQGATSTTLSAAFVRKLPELTSLSLDGVHRDLDALASVHNLRSLHMTGARAGALEPLRGHRSLEVLHLAFGSERSLQPLADIPNLRGLELYQVRQLDDDDLAPLAMCARLQVLSLGALRHVSTLAALAGAPAATLRYALLEKIGGLSSFDDLVDCAALRSLGLWDSRPADRRLSPLLKLQNLDALTIGDVYSANEVENLNQHFRGTYLRYRNKIARGQPADHTPHWRARIDHQLQED